MKDVKEVLKVGLLVVVIGVIIGGLLFWVDQNRMHETEEEQAVRSQEYVQPQVSTPELSYPALSFPLSIRLYAIL